MTGTSDGAFSSWVESLDAAAALGGAAALSTAVVAFGMLGSVGLTRGTDRGALTRTGGGPCGNTAAATTGAGIDPGACSATGTSDGTGAGGALVGGGVAVRAAGTMGRKVAAEGAGAHARRVPTTSAPTMARPITVPPTTPFHEDEVGASRATSRTAKSGVEMFATTGGKEPYVLGPIGGGGRMGAGGGGADMAWSAAGGATEARGQGRAGVEAFAGATGLGRRVAEGASAAGAIFRRTSRVAGRFGRLESWVDMSVPVRMDRRRVARPRPRVVFVTQGRLRKSPRTC
jgi:hypothetical protein